jgi:hypothetical protein
MATATVPLKLHEVAALHSDVRAALQDAINDHRRDKGGNHYGDQYIDHDGDGSEGNVYYTCKGNTCQSPYEMGALQGKAPTAQVDFDQKKNVLPVTQYLPEPEDEDHYTSMDEAFRKDQLYTELPAYERFISQKTRDAADTGDFAGKSRSFPILKPADVSAALHSIGRAGPGNYSSDALRSRIKSIAKRKGFPLPDSLKDSKGESAVQAASGVKLVESAAFAEDTKFTEASAVNPLVKIISAGRGSSGYYTKEMLQRDGPKIFKRGTLMYINHATPAEEAQRPEGDWSKLAAVTEGDAYWDENGKGGAALYAPAKVFSEYATQVAEKAPYTGVSIRATGHYESAAGRIGPEVKLEESKLAPDGKPGLIGALTEADSIDLVTKAGRDGKLFLESATQGETDMDKAAVEALIKESMAPVLAENARLRETISRQGAPQAIAEALREIRLPGPVHVVEATRMRIVQNLTPHVPLAADGKFDTKKLGEMVEAEALAEAQHLQRMGFGQDVTGIGKRMTEAEITAARETDSKAFQEAYEQSMDTLADFFVGKKYQKGTVTEATRQARKAARKTFVEGRAA